MSLDEIKHDLSKNLQGNLSHFLDNFRSLLDIDSQAYEDVNTLFNRYRKAFRNFNIYGTIDNSTFSVEENRIREGVDYLINELFETDLVGGAREKFCFYPLKKITQSSVKNAYQTVVPAKKTGYILYRIPKVMGKDQMGRCHIRIAYTDDHLYDVHEKDKHTQVKLGSIRNTMEVVSINDEETTPFKITTKNSPLQFIDEERFSEWIYRATPNEEGNYTLSFMVTLYQQVGNKSVPKELIIEKDVEVNTEKYKKLNSEVGKPDEQNSDEFKILGTFVDFFIPTTPLVPPPPPPPPSPPPSILGKAAIATIGVIIICWLFFIPPAFDKIGYNDIYPEYTTIKKGNYPPFELFLQRKGSLVKPNKPIATIKDIKKDTIFFETYGAKFGDILIVEDDFPIYPFSDRLTIPTPLLKAYCDENNQEVNIEGGVPPYQLLVERNNKILYQETLFNTCFLIEDIYVDSVKGIDSLFIIDAFQQKIRLNKIDCFKPTPSSPTVKAISNLTISHSITSKQLQIKIDGNLPPYNIVIKNGYIENYNGKKEDSITTFNIDLNQLNRKNSVSITVTDRANNIKSKKINLSEITSPESCQLGLKIVYPDEVSAGLIEDELAYIIKNGRHPFKLRIIERARKTTLLEWQDLKSGNHRKNLEKYKQEKIRQCLLIIEDENECVVKKPFILEANSTKTCTDLDLWPKYDCLTDAQINNGNSIIYASKGWFEDDQKMQNEIFCSDKFKQCITVKNYSTANVVLSRGCPNVKNKILEPTVFYRQSRGSSWSKLTGFIPVDSLVAVLCPTGQPTPNNPDKKVLKINPGISSGFTLQLAAFTNKRNFDALVNRIQNKVPDETILMETNPAGKFILFLGLEENKTDIQVYKNNLSKKYPSSIIAPDIINGAMIINLETYMKGK